MPAQSQLHEKMATRADALFRAQEEAVHRNTDRLFGGLLVMEWLAGIAVALLVSPLSWSGTVSEIHIHVWTAVLLGATIVFWPIYLAINHPGKTITRHVIAVGQMLYSALLIHLTGGRISLNIVTGGSDYDQHRDGDLAIKDDRRFLLADLVVRFDFRSLVFG